MSISKGIGIKIRNFRKQRKLTVAQLGKKIYKSKATVSKYENGEIVIDIITLHEIANALQINVEQLLEPTIQYEDDEKQKNNGFFENNNTFYTYFFDGRTNKVILSVLKITSAIHDNRAKAYLYMNCSNFEEYEICEYTYAGYVEHHNILTNIILNNVSAPIEHTNISIISPFNDSPIKLGLFSSISTRPVMPIASKMLFSKKPLEITNDLINKLLISNDDIRLIQIYNMFTINQES